MENNLCTEIRQTILKQATPFCLTDIYTRLKYLTDDRNLILDCVNELYDRGLLVYKWMEKDLWAFVVS